MKRLLALFAAVCLCLTAAAQTSDFDYVFLNNGSVIKGVIENEVPNVSVTIRSVNGEVYTYPAIEVRKVARGKDPKIPDTSKAKNPHVEYTHNDTGFWFVAELQGGYSCRVNKGNVGLMELDAVIGYRVNEYFRFGVGVGGRYYFNNEEVRWSSVEWSFPIYANFRGNIIPTEYRKVVPYYSLDIGGSIRDGFMVRPTIGIRVGEPRNAFLLGLSYLGQEVDSYELVPPLVEKKSKFISAVTLKIGYEF